MLLSASTVRAQYIWSGSNAIESIPGIHIAPKSIERPLDTAADPPLMLQAIPNTAPRNIFGYLLNDDPTYNRRYDWWFPALKITAANVVLQMTDRFIFNYDYSHISFNSWSHNLKTGWEWDDDRFGVNMFLHPYTGVGYFNAARSSGYSFWESIPFVAGGSLMWEYFGETTLPSKNDLIYTTTGGTFGGEILYRLSSDVLDDTKTGAERFWLEVAAGILSPTRFVSRVLTGKINRVTPEDVYQKEPINIGLYAGGHVVNDGTSFGSGTVSEVFNMQLDYGDPFEIVDRKPYDVFKVRGDLNFGVGRKFVDNVVGYGLLFGDTYQGDKTSTLYGGFQEYDYWDNRSFELTTLGFGGGLINKYPLTPNSNIYTTILLSLVPFGGNSTRLGPSDTSQTRDYNYGGGLQGKFESTLALGNTATASIIANYYWFHTYVGEAGNNFIAIVRPRVTVALFSDVNIGFEEMLYHSDRYSPDFDAIHTMHTEQRIFLQLYFEDAKRTGHYE